MDARQKSVETSIRYCACCDITNKYGSVKCILILLKIGKYKVICIDMLQLLQCICMPMYIGYVLPILFMSDVYMLYIIKGTKLIQHTFMLMQTKLILQVISMCMDIQWNWIHIHGHRNHFLNQQLEVAPPRPQTRLNMLNQPIVD